MTGQEPDGPQPGSRGAEPERVGPYLAAVLADPAWRDCSVALISGGRSNLTYRVTSGAGHVVLRRPPLGHVLPTAHDMVREHRVQAALAATAVPVPRMLALCEDTDVLGATFYVMSDVAGPIVREAFPPGYANDPAQRRAVSDALVDVLADLHQVDPAAVGLVDFGRPDGFMARQVRRWAKQWAATRNAVPQDAGTLMDRLGTRLAEQVPVSGPASVVHGDYRLDNTILDPDRPGRIAAVLDWEMSTLGDPLADLGLLLVYWSDGDDEPNRRPSVPTVTDLPGFATRTEVTERYAARTGRDVTALPWYVAFGFYKLAAVCAGIAARVAAGAMLGEGFEGWDRKVRPLAAAAWESLDSATGRR